MRFRPLVTSLLYATSNITTRTRIPVQAHLSALRSIVPVRSMSFLGSLFGSSSSNSSSKMSYPDQRTNDEWRAVLNKGEFHAPSPPTSHLISIASIYGGKLTPIPQSNSASSVKREPNPPAPASSTSTIQRKVFTHAPVAPRRSTRRSRSSSRAAAGPPTLTASPEP
jgi:hypothetical protein